MNARATPGHPRDIRRLSGFGVEMAVATRDRAPALGVASRGRQAAPGRGPDIGRNEAGTRAERGAGRKGHACN
jgi:hypothetical protein